LVPGFFPRLVFFADFLIISNISDTGYRINIKNFALMRNLRNIKVLDPSPVLLHSDEDGEEIWGIDSVHPLLLWYRLLCDMYENEMSLLLGKTRKRSGDSVQPPPKRARTEPRPAWIETPKQNAVRKDWRNDRGKNRGRGGWIPRGRGGPGWNRGRGGRGGRGGRAAEAGDNFDPS
jgi:hypothetical protein